MDTVRVAVVGSGGMATRRADTFSSTEGFELAAIAARNSDTGPPLADRHSVELLTDWKSLLGRDDIDALVVCTHNEIHGEIVLSGLEAGKHVFTEYPVARYREETARLRSLIGKSDAVLCLAHGETVSAFHRALKEQARGLGELQAALFQRLTPGRGARPEVLFNLNLSGPPALFFVYHVYPLVDMFGPADWVDCAVKYGGMGDDGGYDHFVNLLTVGFRDGGLAQWNWAGGIEIENAEEQQRIVLTGGTLVRSERGWAVSARTGEEPVAKADDDDRTLESRFLEEIAHADGGWRADAVRAIDAAEVGLAAEISAKEGRRVSLSEF